MIVRTVCRFAVWDDVGIVPYEKDGFGRRHKALNLYALGSSCTATPFDSPPFFF